MDIVLARPLVFRSFEFQAADFPSFFFDTAEYIAFFLTMLMERQLPPPIDDDDAEAGCKLMDSFAIFIQLCLAAAAFSTLIIKRQREQPQRPVRIWYEAWQECHHRSARAAS